MKFISDSFKTPDDVCANIIANYNNLPFTKIASFLISWLLGMCYILRDKSII